MSQNSPTSLQVPSLSDPLSYTELEQSSEPFQNQDYLNVEIKDRLINDSPNNSQENQEEMNQQTLDSCSQHTDQPFLLFCKTCSRLICQLCLEEGLCSNHDYLDLEQLHHFQIEQLKQCQLKTKSQIQHLHEESFKLENFQSQLKSKYQESLRSIEKMHSYLIQTIQERKEDITQELEDLYSFRLQMIKESKGLVESNTGELNDAEVLIDTLLPLPFNTKFIGLMFEIFQKIEELINFRVDLSPLKDFSKQLHFSSNKPLIKPTIKNLFGQLGIAKETELKAFNELDSSRVESIGVGQKGSTALYRGEAQSYNQSLDPLQQRSFPDHSHASNFGSDSSRSSLYQNLQTQFNCGVETGLTSEELARSIVPKFNVDQELKRLKMEYHCKFGEFGSEPGQFTEPSGVAVGRNNEILVADANNHRIQAFDCLGVFRRIIGQETSRSSSDSKGPSEGDLVYPNRLAINRVTGEIYVTERSPTHQVRVYDEGGRFVKRFGSHVLQHPRGITVDKLGRIIVIECKVMRVVIFNSSGSVLNRFVVEKKVNFPNGVAVNDKEEIFISDNRRHGIVVFDYQGAFLRTIGGIGVTNYPIGVGINSQGEVVVADNHNNFNVTIFTQEGKLLRALESRVKHAQCFDTSLMEGGSIVLSSKDFRIYIYHYAAN